MRMAGILRERGYARFPAADSIRGEFIPARRGIRRRNAARIWGRAM
jgi:hypothetical protein